MGTNNKRTSSKMATQAAETMNDPNASGIAKSLAASALAQSAGGKQTGAEMEDKAARVLASEKYSDATKALAATVLSQANKER